MTDINDIEKAACEIMTAAGIGEFIDGLKGIGFFTAPASKGHHLAFPGGLLTHSMNVTSTLLKLTGALNIEWSRPDSPIIVGMLHDLVKCKCYRLKIIRIENGIPIAPVEYEYVDPGFPGHGRASVMIADKLGIKLNPDESAAIRWHMGLFDMKDPVDRRDFECAVSDFGPQVLNTHFADWYAAAVMEKGV